MEELKSCIFCGKPVDRDYAYCPWCGYEFGPGDDVPIPRHEPPAARTALAAETVPEPQPAAAEAPAANQSVLLRLTTLEELLSDMERELDLILRTSSRGP